MSNDRELLELAAKALGHKIVQWVEKNDWWSARLECPPGSGLGLIPWNPLIDAQDAFGLSVGLGLCIRQKVRYVEVYPGLFPHSAQVQVFTEPVGDNRRAATALAIVRCAAAIGRTMK